MKMCMSMNKNENDLDTLNRAIDLLLVLPEDTFPWTQVFAELLDDAQKVEDATDLPHTGVPVDYERMISSIKVEVCEVPVSPPKQVDPSAKSITIAAIGAETTFGLLHCSIAVISTAFIICLNWLIHLYNRSRFLELVKKDI